MRSLEAALQIRSMHLVRNKEDQFRGFAYVEFDNTASVEYALSLDGSVRTIVAI